MAKRAAPGDGQQGVTNLTEAKAVVAEEVRKIMNWKVQRGELNDNISASKKRVKSYGIPPAALDYAIKIKGMDPEDRQKHDEGCAIARDAMGLGFQRSLFEMLDERMESEATAAEGKAAVAPKAAPKGPDGDHDLAGEDEGDGKVTPISAAIDASKAHLGTTETKPTPDALH